LNKFPIYKPLGKRAILIEWPEKIDENILNEIILFQKRVESLKADKLQDTIIGYNSLTLVYCKAYKDYDTEINEISSLNTHRTLEPKQNNRLWRIPVCYDEEFGIDLLEMSKKLDLSVGEIVKLHSENIYTVYFIGFLPGFLYLGGLHDKLVMPRRDNPRLRVSKGSVGIGGSQTGVYPIDSAGGWNIIGRTPVSFFNIKQEKPCFAKAGDNIQFIPISKSDYFELEKKIKAGNYILKVQPI
jgi:inhibitor of KinA